MKRTTLLGVLLVAVLACSAALTTVRPAHAILCCEDGGSSSVQHWKMASTCADAQAQWRAEALPEAQADCGGVTKVCNTSVPDCYLSNGMYVADGFLSWGCRVDCGPLTP